VFRAIDDAQSRVAACKVVNLFISPSMGHGTPNVKELQKEVQVHKSLKHSYILEFLHSEVVDRERERDGWVPGLYMLLELAVGGDLFDKIGVPCLESLNDSRFQADDISARCGSSRRSGKVLLLPARLRDCKSLTMTMKNSGLMTL
jgi:serine/threonine-protein kinase Chk1